MTEQDPAAQADAREDALHVGATRPAMLWGLPLPLAIILLGLGYEVLINLPGWHALAFVAAVWPPVWWALTRVIAHDLYGINVAVAWARTSGVTFDRGTWGGASRSPLPARPRLRARGMHHAG